jgi:hypothetical protein
MSQLKELSRLTTKCLSMVLYTIKKCLAVKNIFLFIGSNLGDVVFLGLLNSLFLRPEAFIALCMLIVSRGL